MTSETLSSPYRTPTAILERNLARQNERRTASIFAHGAFGTCICLQRFGVPLGSSTILSASLPVLWLLVGWMMLSGRAKFHMPSTLVCSFVLKG